MRTRSEELHPRAVLEARLRSAELDATQKSEVLERARAESRDVSHAQAEAERTAAARDEIAAELDELKDGEKQ
jgi:hypothetical protein